MVKEGWNVRIVDQPCMAGIDVFIFREAPDHRLEMVTDLSGKDGVTMKNIPRGERMEPAMQLNWHCQELLQAMSDGLFNFGIKPTQEPILKNEMTATKAHLEDMREIVAHALELPIKTGKEKADVNESS